jgi:hypothetical protein
MEPTCDHTGYPSLGKLGGLARRLRRASTSALAPISREYTPFHKIPILAKICIANSDLKVTNSHEWNGLIAPLKLNNINFSKKWIY